MAVKMDKALALKASGYRYSTNKAPYFNVIKNISNIVVLVNSDTQAKKCII